MKLSRLILRQQLGSALSFCCNKSPRQRNVPSDLTLHFRVGGYQFSSIYVIVFKSLPLQRVHTYPDSLRFQKFATLGTSYSVTNNTKFCPQTDFSVTILILSSISAEYADKRWIKITRIRELRQLLPVGLYFIRRTSYTD